jgi:mannosyltransferase OCH1-like enzyme
MNCVEKIYGEKGIFNKLKTIKCTNFEIKDSYQSVVPLNLYLTWGIKKLPPKMQENVDRMRKVNPEFDVYVYDDNDCREFIKNNFPGDILTAYDTLKPGAYKADLWRLCILYINGGIYIDIKFNCINNFKFIALTEREHLALDRPEHWKEGEIGLYNALLVAKPKNEFLLRCINKISENVKNKYYGINSLYPTGPGLLGEQYIKMLRENESTMEAEIDLCMENYQIIFNNVAILEFYKEYRTEQKIFAKTQTYDELYNLKQIYNNNIDGNTSVFVFIFNRGNLILFCAIIIVIYYLSKLMD